MKPASSSSRPPPSARCSLLRSVLAAQGTPDLTGTWTGTVHDRFVRNSAADGMIVTWV